MVFDADALNAYVKLAALMAVSGFAGAILFWFIGYFIGTGISLFKSIGNGV